MLLNQGSRCFSQTRVGSGGIALQCEGAAASNLDAAARSGKDYFEMNDNALFLFKRLGGLRSSHEDIIAKTYSSIRR